MHDPKERCCSFQPPVSELDEYIKELLASRRAGNAKAGKVYKWGQLKESYLADTVYLPEGLLPKGRVYGSCGQYFVMGDNRPHSSDSRAWGPVVKNKISAGPDSLLAVVELYQS